MPLPADPRAAETLPVPDDEAPPWPSQAPPGPSQALPGPSQALPQPAAAPRFEVLREVARGGLGRILEAHDRQLDRHVALKELLRDSPRDRARLQREIHLTARLQHPAIVPLYDAVIDPDGGLRYAMKLVSGDTLEIAIQRAPDLEARLALLRHLEAVADALAYAHSQGVIHRDVKPQNVLIGPFGETVLIDWGIARTLDEEPVAEEEGSPLAPPVGPPQGSTSGAPLTQVGSVVGTPAYMAPEQARGEPADRRADVYALGASLYHLLSGHPPWQADAATTLQALRDGRAPPPLPRISPGLPADLVSIVARAMAPEPADRYPSALELSRDLQAFRTGQLVAARQYSSLDLLRRWLARHRALVAVSGLAVAALALVGGLSARRVVAERDLAHAARAVAEARSHALILANARRGVAQDPTEAAGWLASYPDDGANPAERFDLAQELALYGVARVAVRHESDGCDSLAWSADGLRLLPAGLRTGPLDASTGAPLGVVGTGRSELILPRPDGGSIWLDGVGRVQHLRPDGRVQDLPALGAAPLAATWDGPDHLLVGDRAGGVNRLSLDGGPLLRLHQLDGPVTALARAEGRWYALGPAGALWSGPSRTEGTPRLLLRHAVDLGPLQVAPGGEVLLGDAEGGVHTWTEAGGLRVRARLPGAITALAVSADGAWIAAADGTGALQVWRHDDPAPADSALHPPWPAARVIGMAWAPTAGVLAVHLADGSLRLWWPDTGQVAARRSAAATHAAPAFSPDGRSVASCGVDGSVRVWEVPLEGAAELHGHEGRIFHVQPLPDGRFATDSDDRTVRLWTPDHPMGQVLRAHADRVYGLSLSPDGRTLLSAGIDGLAMAWDLATGEGRALARVEGRVHRAGFLPDGSLAFTAGQDGHLRTWQPDGTIRAQVQAHDGAAWWAEPDAAGDALWSVGADRRLVRWDLASGQLQVLAEGLGERGGDTLRPYRLAGDRVLVCDGRGGLAVFGPEGRRDHPLPFSPVCPSLRVSPAGDWVAVPSGGEVHRFDPRDGTTRLLARQAAEIHAIALSGDGRLLATAGLDGTARIWRVDDGAAAIAWRADGPVLGVAFSADGRHLAAAGVDAVLWSGPVDEARLVPADPAALGAWIRGLTSFRAPELPASPPPP